MEASLEEAEGESIGREHLVESVEGRLEVVEDRLGASAQEAAGSGEGAGVGCSGCV